MTTQARTVLIIDDDLSWRALMHGTLELEGYSCFEAIDGAAGLEKVMNATQRLIILLGIIMPRMTGDEVLRRMEELYLLERHAVIVVTGSGHWLSQQADIMALMKRRHIPLLPKPFQWEMLLATLDAAVKRLQAPPVEQNGSGPQ
jgi:two-component system, chemotaxis family, chemotaxis protein CheY